MSQALQIARFGGPEVLKLVDEPSPPMKPDSVRIRVSASGVNFADIMMRMGTYPEAPKPPFIPGYEISGTVMEIGTSVKSVHPGDRVLAGCRFGGYTKEIVIPEFQVRRIPGNLTDSEAAAIPVNFMTAWLALEDLARVRKGDRVLIQSAAGGVGTAAVQIAAQAGAHVIGLVGSQVKADVVKSLGAAEVMLNEEWENKEDEELPEYQVILDSVGGESLKRSYRRLAPGGRVVTFGVSSIVGGQKRSLSRAVSLLFNTALFTPYRLMMDNKGVFGVNLLQLFEEPKPGQTDLLGNALNKILEKFANNQFKVVIGKTFPLAQGAEAHDYLQSRSNIGKVILN